MKILVIGGSRFQGLYICKELSNRGNEITILNRGYTKQEENRSYVRHVQGDRTDEHCFRQITHEKFDICIDTSGYKQEDVERSAKSIDCEKYVFISTIFGYKETADIVTRHTPSRSMDGEGYTQNKLKCEEKLKLEMEEKRLLIVRPSMLIGVGDHTERMLLAIKLVRNGKWPAREVWKKRINLLDIRDYTKNLIELIEEGYTGTYKLTGTNTTIGSLWETIQRNIDPIKHNIKEISESDYCPYIETETENIYMNENPITNRWDLEDTIKILIEEEKTKELTRYKEIAEKYLVRKYS